jgi:hypothetical protein
VDQETDDVGAREEEPRASALGDALFDSLHQAMGEAEGELPGRFLVIHGSIASILAQGVDVSSPARRIPVGSDGTRRSLPRERRFDDGVGGWEAGGP